MQLTNRGLLTTIASWQTFQTTSTSRPLLVLNMWTKIDIAVLYSMLHSQRPSLKCALICNKLIISNLNKVKKYYHDSFFRNKTSTEAFLGGDTIFYFCRGKGPESPNATCWQIRVADGGLEDRRNECRPPAPYVRGRPLLPPPRLCSPPCSPVPMWRHWGRPPLPSPPPQSPLTYSVSPGEELGESQV